MPNIYREAIQNPSDRVILALDDMSWPKALSMVETTNPHIGMAKANSLAQVVGWQKTMMSIAEFGSGMLTMADAKFHDIPKTVELQVEEVTTCSPGFITVHASGGKEMLRSAVIGRNRGRDNLIDQELIDRKDRIGGILGITVLTSLDTDECISIYGDNPERKVVQFAHTALEAGIDGIVCSGKEPRAIRAISALDRLITVVPGITPGWTLKAGDQKRVVTPAEALEHGADFIVVGRAITQPPEGISHVEAAQRVVEEVNLATAA